ncbi:MAG: hypothetical protein NHB32_02175 [Fischerella sp. CENA71]|nr:hypothetical protein [Fischerella sp. CENA71]
MLMVINITFSGKVLFEEVSAAEAMGKVELAIAEVSNWVLDQARTDIFQFAP